MTRLTEQERRDLERQKTAIEREAARLQELHDELLQRVADALPFVDGPAAELTARQYFERPCRLCQDDDHDRCLTLEWVPEFNENRCCCEDVGEWP